MTKPVTKRVLAWLLVPLSGCALHAGTLRQQEAPLVYPSARPPAQAAACVAANMEKVLLTARTAIRPLPSGAGFEVIATGPDHSIYALAEIAASGGGTRASLWFSPVLHMLRGPQETGMKFMLEC